MPTLHVRDVPTQLYEELRRRAVTEGRSLSAEVIKLLEVGVRQPQLLDSAFWERIDQRRQALEREFGQFPSSVDDLRDDRSRE
jgi:plasmid stability protein